MSENDKNVDVTIIIGCGGTGATTLRQLNAHLALDQSWRTRIAKEICYVLVDTDKKETKRFENDIRADLGANLPIIKCIDLSDKLTSLEEVTNDFFPENNDDSTDLRKQHWWFQDPENKKNPFCAQELQGSLADGAGQCPPVSFLLAWRKLSMLNNELENLMARIKTQCAPTNGVVKNASLWIVAGLAGGTGRGCWHLLGFAFRHYLQQQNITVMPRGFFFDSTIFKDVGCKPPFAMGINALTGLSELSAWMVNLKGTDKSALYKYQLPSLLNGAEQMIIDSERYSQSNRAHVAPINHASLFFDSTNPLQGPEQYKEMVGTGMYAILASSKIASDISNISGRYSSFGTVSYEVDTKGLRRFFEKRLKGAFFKKLSAKLDDNDPKKATVDKFAEEFLAKNGFLPKKPMDQCLSEMTSPDAGKIGSLWIEHGKSLVSQKLNLENLLQNKGKSVAEIKEQVSSLLKKDDGRLMPDSTKEECEKSFRQALATDCRNVFAKTNSIRAVQEFCKAVQQEWDRMSLDINRGVKESPMCGRTLREIDKAAASRDLIIFGDLINAQERKSICDAFAAESMDVTRRLIVKSYLSCMAEIIKRVTEDYKSVLNKYCETYGDFEKTYAKDDSKTNEDLSYDALFTDPLRPETVFHKDDSNLFYKRVLKPVAFKDTKHREKADKDLKALNLKTVDELIDSRLKIPEEIAEMLTMPFNNETKISELAAVVGDPGAWKREIRPFKEKLEDLVDKKLSLPPDFIYEFIIYTSKKDGGDEIGGVVKDLLAVFEVRFNNFGSTQADMDKLNQDFAEFFGFEPKHTPDGYSLFNRDVPDIAAVIGSMGASATGKCKPYWSKKTDRQLSKVRLFIPMETSKDKQTTIKNSIKRELGLETDDLIEVIMLGDDNMSNPFSMIAYTNQEAASLDELNDVNYWENAPYPKWLKLCETGESIFLYENENKGIGFLDPTFINDKNFSGMRWKPWAPAQSQDQKDNNVVDAMIYALMDIGKLGESSGIIDVRVAMGKLSWPVTALMVRDSENVVSSQRNTYKFSRKPYIIRGETVRDDPEALWKIGQQLSTNAGITNVYQLLASEEGRDYLNRILEEKRLFDKEVLEKNGLNTGTLYDNFLDGIQSQLVKWKEDEPNKDRKSNNEETWKRLISRIGKLMSSQR